MLRLSTRLHKWIALIVGVQVLFWTLGGLIMTVIPIETVRSEHRLAERRAEPLPPSALPVLAGRDAVEATLKSAPRAVVWVLKDADGKATVLSADGKPLPPLAEPEARRLAAHAYKGEGKPVSARHFAQAPQETGRDGPLWRVDFDDAERTSFYLDPQTGEVVSRRSAVWRVYDFLWRLHILDFKTGEDFNHPLIIGVSVLAVAMTLTGFVLLWFRFFPRRRA
ncbi:MAG TPA: PepSY domain-containing protein [Caulobacteraceae bacterium]|nr:PepSY domain-containing protein [Caulobacteraceae bacterium]